jgi:hypothetical protein
VILTHLGFSGRPGTPGREVLTRNDVSYQNCFKLALNSLHRVAVSVRSTEIAGASLHGAIPWYTYLYAAPFLSLYPILAYAYFVKYDEWIVSEEWTFVFTTALCAGHALSFLVTRWSTGARAWITTKTVRSFFSVIQMYLTDYF